jgi:GNAT superfamily N-acetyltransferase
MEKILYGELQNVPLTKRHNLSSFESTNVDLNDFLKNDALADQEWLVSKTYLCYWNKSMAGYITLVTDTLEVKVVDEEDGIKDYPYRKYPSLRIARLAVDKTFERRGIGRFLMLAAIGMAIDVSSKVGCRYISVDSKPESVGFYERHGFKLIERYRNSDFPKMYLNMYPIIERMQPLESLEEFET